uniref:Serpentine receptor class gamma n=1 Tax=Panagrolaimus sp. PS1159 TaxID=55785 RepID=A0AC35GJW9_9BILA
MIWDKCLWIFIIVSLAYPFMLNLDLLFGYADIIPFLIDGSDDTYVFAIMAPKWHISKMLGGKSMLSALHTTVTSLCAVTFNISSFITLFIRTRNVKNQSKLPKKGEINLLILSCVDFALDCLSETHQVYMWTFVINKDMYNPIFDRLCLLYPWIYDIINLSRPYLLLIMCNQMQSAFLSVIKFPLKKQKVSNSSITVSSINVF